jgi:hypothetical protein
MPKWLAKTVAWLIAHPEVVKAAADLAKKALPKQA